VIAQLWSDIALPQWKEFSWDEVRGILKAVGHRFQIDASACARFDELAFFYFAGRMNKTAKQKQNAAARQIARLRKRRVSVCDPKEIAHIEAEIDACERVRRMFATERSDRRERPDGAATRNLTMGLGLEFRECFGRAPSALPNGPFERFVEAYLRAVRLKVGPANIVPTSGRIVREWSRLKKQLPKG